MQAEISYVKDVVVTPANIALRQASELPMDDDQIAKLLTWSVDDVCGWLKKVGLDGYFEKQFRRHEISGDILPLIHLPELKDMAADLVGPRTQLIKKLGKLKRAYVGYKRNRVLWSGKEHSCCLKDYITNCCCPPPPPEYNLTSSHLKIEETIYPYTKFCGCCCRGRDVDSIDLSMILDVDTTTDSNCCSCDNGTMVIIQQKDKREHSSMFLKTDEGPKVARMIRDAVEENQAGDKQLTPHM